MDEALRRKLDRIVQLLTVIAVLLGGLVVLQFDAASSSVGDLLVLAVLVAVVGLLVTNLTDERSFQE